MTVLLEAYWTEIALGLAGHGVPVRHLVLHDAPDVVCRRIRDDDDLGPSAFRLATPRRTPPRSGWLSRDAEVVDTADLAPAAVADEVARLVGRRRDHQG